MWDLLLSSIWIGHRLKATWFQIENSGSGWLWFYCIVHYTGQHYTLFLEAEGVWWINGAALLFSPAPSDIDLSFPSARLFEYVPVLLHLALNKFHPPSFSGRRAQWVHAPYEFSTHHLSSLSFWKRLTILCHRLLLWCRRKLLENVCAS